MINSKVNDFNRAAEGVPHPERPIVDFIPFHLDSIDAHDEILMAMGVGELHVQEEVWMDITFTPASKQELQKRIAKAEKWVQSPSNEPVSWKAFCTK